MPAAERGGQRRADTCRLAPPGIGLRPVVHGQRPKIAGSCGDMSTKMRTWASNMQRSRGGAPVERWGDMHAMAFIYSPADPYNPADVPATIGVVVLAKVRIRGNATPAQKRNRPPTSSSAGDLTSREVAGIPTRLRVFDHCRLGSQCPHGSEHPHSSEDKP